MSSDDAAPRAWTAGSYTEIGRNFLSMAAHLVEVAGIEAGDRVLDVACGTGNVAISAARRGASVTGLDITPPMLADARENAELAGVPDVEWHEGDATDLPFPADRFDVTLSCVGHMFAEPADAAAAELVRVTRPGGTIAFTSWTPRSVVPAMAKVLQGYLPPDPDGSAPPFAWGDPDVVEERLGGAIAAIDYETGTIDQLTLSPAHYWEWVRERSGLFIVALENVEPADRPALREDLIAAVEPYFDEAQNTVEMEYRLTTATVD